MTRAILEGAAFFVCVAAILSAALDVTMTLPIIDAALAVQEPVDADALAREGAWSIKPVDLSGYEFALKRAGEEQARVAALQEAAKQAHAAIDARLATSQRPRRTSSPSSWVAPPRPRNGTSPASSSVSVAATSS